MKPQATPHSVPVTTTPKGLEAEVFTGKMPLLLFNQQFQITDDTSVSKYVMEVICLFIDLCRQQFETCIFCESQTKQCSSCSL